MDQKYSHSHDAVAVVDRLPLLIMIAVSIGFGLFPMHLYNVVRSGVDPLVAKITLVVPVAAEDRETLRVNREARADASPLADTAAEDRLTLGVKRDASRLTANPLREMR
jgi:NADH-quinone oxidoreductase subunit M